MGVIDTLEQYPIFDIAILHHGFVPYLRDYEILTETDWLMEGLGAIVIFSLTAL